MKSTHHYGPYREVAKQHVYTKDVCTKDSVRDALYKGEYGTNSDWFTSTKDSCKDEGVIKKEETKPRRNTTNIVLGFDKTRYVTTNNVYRGTSQIIPPCQLQNGNSFQNSSILELNPGTDAKLDCSEYKVKFIEGDRSSIAKPMTLEERRRHTNDLRSTHFQLGRDPDLRTTETRHSFVQSNGGSSARVCAPHETYKSQVFRQGDWNEENRSLVSQSVTGKDFGKTSNALASANEDYDIMNDDYHNGTHFCLGSDGDATGSIYRKDFLSTSEAAPTERVSLGSHPPATQIFHSPVKSELSSTHSESFKAVDDHDYLLTLKQERDKALLDYKTRQRSNSIPIVVRAEDSGSANISLTSSDFLWRSGFSEGDSKTEKKADDAGIPQYNYLSSNYDKAVTTEVKGEFVAHSGLSPNTRLECKERQQTNKSTHFVFGTDANINCTEQASQYRRHLPIDPDLKSAGKSQPQTNTYSHVYPCVTAYTKTGSRFYPVILDGSTDNKLHRTSLPNSVMKDDYVHKTSIVNEKEEETRYKNEDIVESHFFHKDNQYSGTKKSTTQSDFISPDISKR